MSSAALATPELSSEILRSAATMMLHIRGFEQRVRKEFARGDIPGFVHTCLGTEAVVAGMIMHLDDRDLVTSTHRGHGHCLAKGAPLNNMVAELYGREDGLCRGRGGSMHIADFSHGMLGANAIVAGGIPLAVGGALASSVLADGRVSVAFFGDGATNEGIFHESLNLAAIWRLPVIFVCENNGWAESTPVGYSTSVEHISQRAAGYSIPGHTIDGTDFEAVYQAAGTAVSRARDGGGPSLLEMKVARLDGHYVGDPQGYRVAASAPLGGEHDPVHRFCEQLVEAAMLSRAEIEQISHDWEGKLDAAYQFAQQSRWPEPDDVERYVFSS